jgi:diguanylate cyclase (GGDEF)-like protein
MESMLPQLAIGALALLECQADGLQLVNSDEETLWTNAAFGRMYALRSQEAIGKTFEEILAIAWPGMRPPVKERSEPLAENGRHFESALVRYIELPGNRLLRIAEAAFDLQLRLLTHSDVSDLRQHVTSSMATEATAGKWALLKKTTSFEEALEAMDQGVIMVSPDRIVEVCNSKARELLDLPEALMSAKPPFEAVLAYQWSKEEFAHTPEDICDFVRSGGILDQPHRYDRVRPNGRVIEVNSVPIAGGGVLRTFSDITERKRADERIRYVSRHDGLTSLVNREVFLECLTTALDGARRTHEPFAVHYIDLDGFKPLNDRHGHLVGDRVLATLASRMEHIARDSDVVARLGGDEFAVLQLSTSQEAKAVGLAERLLAALCEPISVDLETVAVSASIGVAVWSGHVVDADAIIRNADSAMYTAKAGGGGRIHIFRGV